MNLKSLIEIQSGGPGSGCHGQNCGRPKGHDGPHRPAKSAGPTNDHRSWTQIGTQAGSNPGGLFEDQNGVKHYLKIYPQVERARAEVLANEIYKIMDIPVPETFMTRLNGKDAIASKIIDKPKGMSQGNMAQHKDMQDGFIVDAYLANHDVVGLVMDNVKLSGGKAYRIDNGGSLFYRAMGSRKTFFDSHPDDVPEVDSMRNPAIAREAGKVFQDLSDADVKKQAKKLVSRLSDKRLHKAINDAGFTGKEASQYFKYLSGRRDGIKKRFGI